MNLEMTKTYLGRAIKLVGKRRFHRIFNVYVKLQSPDGNLLLYKYEMATNDCWAMAYFDDRIRNNGYYRYSQGATPHFMEHFCELMVAAQKHNLIKFN
jgi:hypothetical protein